MNYEYDSKVNEIPEHLKDIGKGIDRLGQDIKRTDTDIKTESVIEKKKGLLANLFKAKSILRKKQSEEQEQEQRINTSMKF